MNSKLLVALLGTVVLTGCAGHRVTSDRFTSTDDKIAQMDARDSKIEASVTRVEELHKRDIARVDQSIKTEVTRVEELHKRDIARVDQTIKTEVTRVEELHKRDIARVDQTIKTEVARIDDTHAKDTARIEQTIKTEIARVDDTHAKDTARVEQTIKTQVARIDDTHAKDTARVEQTLKTEIARVDEAHRKDTARIDETHNKAVAKLNDDIKEAMRIARGKFAYVAAPNATVVSFASNSAKVSAEGEQALANLAKSLVRDNKNVFVEIKGYTDATGTEKQNQALAINRAEAARQILNMNGVPLHRMSVIALPAGAAAGAKLTAEDNARARRVTVAIVE